MIAQDDMETQMSVQEEIQNVLARLRCGGHCTVSAKLYERHVGYLLERLEAGPPVDGPHPGDETPGG